SDRRVLSVSQHLPHLAPLPTRRSSDLVTLVAFGIAGALYLVYPEDQLVDIGGPAFWFFTTIILIGAVVENMRNIALSTTVTLLVDRKSTRLNSSHVKISYAVFCLKTTN